MSLDLAPLRSTLPHVDGLATERVRTPRQLETFAALSAANWDPPDPWVIEFYRRAAGPLLSDASPQWLYLGTLDGTPIATAEVTVGGGVVGLYNISTQPAYRGRGIGAAMTLAPLLDARRQGWETAILQAADAGVGIYRRLGFTAFGTITEFKPAALRQ
jgi:ribosomal protein S18 acetylase RimI-like enzyme